MAAVEDEGLEGAPEWITTFVDMISLLVTFFILLFTFASIEQYELFSFPTNIIGTRGTLPTDGGQSMVDPPDADLMSAMDIRRGAPAPHVRPADKLPDSMVDMGKKLMDDQIEFDPMVAADGLVIRFDDASCFRPGSASVSPQLRQALETFADVMQNYPHLIVIEGHTDSEFSPSPRFPDEAALSCARAYAAAQVMFESTKLSPKRVQIAGFGSERPLNGNVTPSERTLNRRVEVRILSIDEQRALALKERRK